MTLNRVGHRLSLFVAHFVASQALAHLWSVTDVIKGFLSITLPRFEGLKASDHLWSRKMASLYDHASVSERAQRSGSTVKNAVLLIAKSAVSLTSRLTGELRTWRRRAQERMELARMSQGELHDIGVSSADHWVETHKPFWRR